MIEGLKVTVPGPEVLKMVQTRSAHHQARAKLYLDKKEQIGGDEEDEAFAKLASSSNDPRDLLERKVKQHLREAEELEFIAKWLNASETYILDDHALRKLGVVNTYW